MNEFGTHASDKIFVKANSPEETPIRSTKPVKASGSEDGQHFLEICIDRSVKNCALCLLGQVYCEYTLDPKATIKTQPLTA
jgi:hypothetical protein